MEASLTLAPDGAAPVFHMVRLPDSVWNLYMSLFLSPIATSSGRLAAQPATTGNSVYIAWPNNDTGQGNVFVAKSSDDGVYVCGTWWTNGSGVLGPVSRASNDGGNTICPMVKLNSTRTKSIFYFILFFR